MIESTKNIQVFLNWLKDIEIQKEPQTRSRIRSKTFINGPYADIKEMIGKISSQDVEPGCVDCQ